MEQTSQASPSGQRLRSTRVLDALRLYGTAVALSVVALVLILQLWRANIRVPLIYATDGDGLYGLTLAKIVVETGWSFHTPRLGAPGTFNDLDFPNPETLNDSAIRFLSFFTSDAGLALNIYYFLTYPLAALSATLAARQLGLTKPIALLVGQLYAFMPFHMIRGEYQVLLTAYYAVPLIVPSLLRIAGGAPLVGPRRITGFAGFILAGLSNAYFAAFAGFFLMVAAIVAYARCRDQKAIATAKKMALVLVLAFSATLAPYLINSARYGTDAAASPRMDNEGDIYGLKLAQMLFPTPGHRIPVLAEFRDKYAGRSPLTDENESAALGIIGACGVVLLLYRQLFGKAQRNPALAAQRSSTMTSAISEQFLDDLAILMLSGILLATVGGLGPMVNYFGFDKIRSYNRISVFLGFFAYLAVGMTIDRALARRHLNQPEYVVGLCLILLVIGLLDQSSPRNVPDYEANLAQFKSDRQFFGSIEASLPAGASIFELPVIRFPEGQVGKLFSYGLFRGYLNSTSLRWSGGAMVGRDVSRWDDLVSRLSPSQLVRTVRDNGFSAIYLDRRGYRNQTLEDQLRTLLGPPLVSPDQKLICFIFRDASGASATKSG